MKVSPPNTSLLWERLLWFAALWGGSVLALGIVSLALRAWLKAS
jgi:hypothetical protein